MRSMRYLITSSAKLSCKTGNRAALLISLCCLASALTANSPVIAQQNGAGAGELAIQYRGKTVSKEFYRAVLISKDAQLLLKNNRLAEATARLKEAVALAPNFAEAEINLGNLLIRQGQYADAVKHLKHATQTDGTIEAGWINLGGAQASMGQAADAEKTYRTFLQKFPSSSYKSKITELVNALQAEQRNSGATQKTSSGTSAASLEDYYAEATGGHRIRWHEDQLPLRVFVPDGTGKKGYKPQFANVVKDCFRQWQKASNERITFRFVDTPGAAAISCNWVDDPNVLKATVKKGETKTSTMGGSIVKATIRLMLGPEVITDSKLRFTALHEIGHALGIQGHSPNPNDVMFFATNIMDANRGLTSRDIKTLLRVYENEYFTAQDVSKQHKEGEAALEAKDYPTAIELFKSVLNARPDMESARVNIGLCYAGQALQYDEAKDYRNAETLYRAALDVRKTLARPELLNSAVQNFAAMLRDRERISEAEELEKQLAK